MPSAPDPRAERLRAELAAIPSAERLDWLADLPAERLTEFKRILPAQDIRKLNDHISRRLRQRAKPTLESWLDEARAGRATSPDAMIAALKEHLARLREQDALWIDRIEQSAAGRSYSRRQVATIRSIYERYFGDQCGE